MGFSKRRLLVLVFYVNAVSLVMIWKYMIAYRLISVDQSREMAVLNQTRSRSTYHWESLNGTDVNERKTRSIHTPGNVASLNISNPTNEIQEGPEIYEMWHKNGWNLSSRSFTQSYSRQCEAATAVNWRGTLPLCGCLPPGLVGRQNVNTTDVPTEEDIARSNPEVQPGGYWKPSDCYSRDKVAIIIPFRDRQSHLNILLKYLHPLLQRQLIEYRIFVVEQATPKIFNKASLMNAGYLEAKKIFNFDCVVFHDVDMIPEDDRNFYTCINSPRHVGAYCNKFGYNIFYIPIFGGAILLTPHQFERINGFSNQYYGWGAEDDDMYRRVSLTGLPIYRYPKSVARYTMVTHGTDAGNPKNTEWVNTWFRVAGKSSTDGLNSVQYYVRSIEERPLYTWIYVELPGHHNS